MLGAIAGDADDNMYGFLPLAGDWRQSPLFSTGSRFTAIQKESRGHGGLLWRLTGNHGDPGSSRA